MNWIGTIIGLFLILVVVMTAVAYPYESVQYGKAITKTGFKLVKDIVKQVAKYQQSKHLNNNTEINKLNKVNEGD